MERCQVQDWYDRHRGVCHNLIGPIVQDVADGFSRQSVVAAPPLRRPRSPQNERPPRSPQERDSRAARDERMSTTSRDTGSDRTVKPSAAEGSGNRGGGRSTRGRNFNPRDGDLRRPAGEPARNNYSQQSAHDQSYNGRGSRANSGRGRNYQPRYNGTSASVPAQDIDGENWDAINPVPLVREASTKKEPRPAQQTTSQPDQKPQRSQPAQEAPRPREPEVKIKETKPVTPAPAFSVADATPVKKVVPKNYLIETMPIGSTIVLSVDSLTADCRVTSPGFVCLSLHSDVEEMFDELCGAYAAVCEEDHVPYTPTPGEVFSYFDTADEGWYRARCVAPSLAALFDSSRVVSITAANRCRHLPPAFQLQPEFSCVLQADKATLESRLSATLLAKSPAGFKVSLADLESGAAVGEGELSRWQPRIDHPVSANATKPAVVIPEVRRPDLKNNSRVFMVHADAMDRVFVRPCDMVSRREYDEILNDVVLYGIKAKPLTTPPVKGTVVVSKFTDGNFYRALVQRTSKEKNKYQLEYLEFGNVHINQLENMYPCPPELDITSRSVVTSLVVLGPATQLTPAAVDLIEPLKDEAEMLLTVNSGTTTVSSGSTVDLIVIKGNLDLNRKLRELCTPQWKLMEQRGQDVLQLPPLMLSSLEFVPIPEDGCTLVVLDASNIEMGVVCGYPKGLSQPNYIFGALTQQMGEYCNSSLGREPYLPKDHELCIAKMPPHKHWFRAMKMSQDGPGSKTACILYVDYGTVHNVPVSLLRKMLPEFIDGFPALGITATIEGFPQNLTKAQLEAARQHLKLDSEGRGELEVTSSDGGHGVVTVEAPRLIQAVRQA